ncbi:MAG: tetratricopeptide repeat protein [Verrucomicrobiota bacterium]|nr:tetratricopeptide repeat protein [Verrucomicrobiota bacterium]
MNAKLCSAIVVIPIALAWSSLADQRVSPRAKQKSAGVAASDRSHDGPVNTTPPTAYELLMLGIQDADHGRLDSAMARLNAVLMMDIPLNLAAAACLARGRLYQMEGDEERAMRDIEQAIRFQPSNPLAYMYRGLLLSIRGDHGAAIQDFSEALRFEPKMFRALYNRAGDYLALADWDLARRDLEDAIQINPSYALAFLRRGTLFMLRRQPETARADYETAARLAPERADPWIALAYLERHCRRYLAAVSHFEKALSKNPAKREVVLSSLSWLRATCPDPQARDGARAKEEAVEACARSGWADARYVETLAAAYAEAGEFEDAVNVEWFAIALMWSQNAMPTRAQERLRLYEKCQPYRETETEDAKDHEEAPDIESLREQINQPWPAWSNAAETA